MGKKTAKPLYEYIKSSEEIDFFYKNKINDRAVQNSTKKLKTGLQLYTSVFERVLR